MWKCPSTYLIHRALGRIFWSSGLLSLSEPVFTIKAFATISTRKVYSLADEEVKSWWGWLHSWWGETRHCGAEYAAIAAAVPSGRASRLLGIVWQFRLQDDAILTFSRKPGWYFLGNLRGKVSYDKNNMSWRVCGAPGMPGGPNQLNCSPLLGGFSLCSRSTIWSPMSHHYHQILRGLRTRHFDGS